MSSTLLEQARMGHEEVEQGVAKIVKLLSTETKTHKQKLMQQHKVLKEVHNMQATARKLTQHYEDVDGSRKQEINSMSGAEVFGGFYGRMRELREYHRKFPNLYYEPEMPEQEVTLADDPEILGQFSGEEAFGRFLDLTAMHTKFINLKGTKAVPYEIYLSLFLDFAAVPANVKTKAYRDYLASLKEYLSAYMTRALPLVDVEALLQQGQDAAEGKPLSDGPEAPIVLEREIEVDEMADMEALKALGLEALKAELMKLGLKCGGTLDDRANRLWATRGKSLRSQLDPSLLAGGGGKAADKEKEKKLQKAIQVLECELIELGDALEDIIEQTKVQLQKKQSRTTEELQAEVDNEMGEEEPESEDSDEEGEKPIYNPKKVPLDWTGKPIPYWLYKLHGLNVEYKCEICGNFSYWGPRAFERHFQEWRHAHGMRCLKIPNSRAFHNITKIQDAIDLMDRLKNQQAAKEFDAQNQEEFEDAMGNVLSKKTYQDLLRQGLL
mmetsp:Transcript_15786/g.37727  ORF Transcript_15786/g.37727 Transcript_15786/m.37727 type:complete len:496 (+) Transcript_15786:200-1687(+)